MTIENFEKVVNINFIWWDLGWWNINFIGLGKGCLRGAIGMGEGKVIL